MSELPAASHNLYWPNWSVVDDGIGTMVTLLPVFFSNWSSMSRRICRPLPVSPDTIDRSAARTGALTNTAAAATAAKDKRNFMTARPPFAFEPAAVKREIATMRASSRGGKRKGRGGGVTLGRVGEADIRRNLGGTDDGASVHGFVRKRISKGRNRSLGGNNSFKLVERPYELRPYFIKVPMLKSTGHLARGRCAWMCRRGLQPEG